MKKRIDENEQENLIMPVPFIDGIEEIRNNLKFLTNSGEVTYGLEILDDAVGFIIPGSITLICACPNVGKSLSAQIIANNIAKQGKKVLICSCEMSAGQLMVREMVRTMGTSNRQLLQAYKHNPNQLNSYFDMLLDNKEYNYLRNILVLDIGDMHIDNLIKIFDMFKDYKYIIVDYVQSLKGDGDDERNQFKDISKKLKSYSLRNGVSIIECAQIPKSNENENRTQKGIDFQKLKALGAGNW